MPAATSTGDVSPRSSRRRQARLPGREYRPLLYGAEKLRHSELVSRGLAEERSTVEVLSHRPLGRQIRFPSDSHVGDAGGELYVNSASQFLDMCGWRVQQALSAKQFDIGRSKKHRPRHIR